MLPTNPRGQKLAHPTSRSGIASQPRLKTNTRAASSPTKNQRIEVHYRLRRHDRAPVRSAEHRRLKRGGRRGLSERPKAASSAAAASTEKRREPEGRVSRVAFSLDTFFWRSKRKYLGCGTNSRSKSTRVSAQEAMGINRFSLYNNPQVPQERDFDGQATIATHDCNPLHCSPQRV